MSTSRIGQNEERVRRAAEAARALGQGARRFYLRGTVFGVEATELDVLVLLLLVPGQLVREIADSLLLPRPTVSNALDRLRRKGLVASEIDPDDRRASRRHLTAEGEDLVKMVLRHHAPYLLKGEPVRHD